MDRYAVKVPDQGMMRVYADFESAAGSARPGDPVYRIMIEEVPGAGAGVLTWDVEYMDHCCNPGWEIWAKYEPDPTVTTKASSLDDDYHYGSIWIARGIRAEGPVEAVEAAIDIFAAERSGDATYQVDPPKPDSYLAIGFDDAPARGSEEYKAGIAKARRIEESDDWKSRYLITI